MAVLAAETVIDADVAALQHRPKRLYAVGTAHPPHIFADAALDRIAPPPKPIVRRRFVSIDIRVRRSSRVCEALQAMLVRPFQDIGFDLLALALFHADHRQLAVRAAPCAEPLVGMFVAFLAADIGFIGFYIAAELKPEPRIFPHFADAVRHMPRGPLRNAQVPMQFHAADAF